jgi:hypothetical protein
MLGNVRATRGIAMCGCVSSPERIGGGGCVPITGPVPFANRVRDGRDATTGWICDWRSLIDGSFGIGMIVGGAVPGRVFSIGLAAIGGIVAIARGGAGGGATGGGGNGSERAGGVGCAGDS